MPADSNREIISLHIGQCGIQVGGACWQVYCLEHGIEPNGQPSVSSSDSPTSCSTFFSESNRRYVPRALFVDLEDTNTNRLRKGAYRDLFHPDSIFNGKEVGHRH